MRIICINDKNSLSVTMKIIDQNLTLNKWYNSQGMGKYYKVINDLGTLQYYEKSRFITLDEYRSIQIDKLI